MLGFTHIFEGGLIAKTGSLGLFFRGRPLASFVEIVHSVILLFFGEIHPYIETCGVPLLRVPIMGGSVGSKLELHGVINSEYISICIMIHFKL